MNDEHDENTNPGETNPEDAEASDADDEIPISTGTDESEAGDDSAEEPTGDEAGHEDESVEIDVQTGPPDPDVDRSVERSGRSERANTGDRFGLDGFEIDLDELRNVGSSRLFDRLDDTVIDLLSRVLDGESQLRVYVALRQRPWSTVGEIADVAGLYPDAVRDALDTLDARGVVERRGPTGEGEAAGVDENDEHEPQYNALKPSTVLTDLLGRRGPGGFADGLDTDRYRETDDPTDGIDEPSDSVGNDPVRIEIDEDDPAESDEAGIDTGDESEDPDDESEN